ncbi:hypothetical protein [Streptomyces humi]
MTTMLERLVTEAKHDPAILLPNVWSDLLHCVQVQCPCGNVTGVRNGVLDTHEPKSTWDMSGQRRAVIADAYDVGYICRYSGRTATLVAALERDSHLTEAEAYVARTVGARLVAGITDTAPAGYALPKPVAALFALAESNGWATAQAWAPRDDGFVLNLRVGRAGGWQYDLSYFVAPGVARRTRSGLCHSPDHRGLRDTPSLKALMTVIRANPVGADG